MSNKTGCPTGKVRFMGGCIPSKKRFIRTCRRYGVNFKTTEEERLEYFRYKKIMKIYNRRISVREYGDIIAGSYPDYIISLNNKIIDERKLKIKKEKLPKDVYGSLPPPV